jgi:hypothetical protein
METLREDDRSGTNAADNFFATMRQKNPNLVEENVDEFLNRDKVQNCRGSNKKNPNSFFAVLQSLPPDSSMSSDACLRPVPLE